MGRYDNLITNRSAKLPGDWKKQPPSIASTNRTGRGNSRGMTKIEVLYADELELRHKAGEVLAWWFQSIKVRLADRTWFTPDFFVILPNGEAEFVEIKGHLEDDAAVKFKVARETYPCFRWTILQRAKGAGWKQILVSSVDVRESVKELFR